jgi:transcriptional regulator with XRE-family HTH domain
MDAMKSDPELIQSLGRRLRAHRIRQELTVEELAAQAGVTPLTVLKAERGSNVTLRTLFRILRVLGLIDQVTGWIPEPLPSPMALLERRGARPGQPERPRQRVRKRRDG